MPTNVESGATVDLSVSLTSPATQGTYIGQWRLTNASGSAFGTNGSPLIVSIVVPAPTTPPTVAPTAAPGATLVIPPLLLPLPPLVIIPLGSRASHYAGNWYNNNVNTSGITQLNVTATSTNAISVQGWGSCSPTDCVWGTGSGTVSGTTITVSNFSSASGTMCYPSRHRERCAR